MNGQLVRCARTGGPAIITSGSGPKERAITPRYAALPTNGSAFYTVAGGIACPIRSSDIWKRFAPTGLPKASRRRMLPSHLSASLKSSGKTVEVFPNRQKFPLDGLTQKSYGRGSLGHTRAHWGTLEG